jgi:hypothetical protein
VAIQMQRSMTWNPIVAFSFLLMATGMSILFLWGLAISADLVFQALHGRPNPQMRLVISCAIGAGVGVLATISSRSHSEYRRAAAWIRPVLLGFVAAAAAVALLNLLTESGKLRSALQDTTHDFWRFAFWPSLIAFSLLWTARIIARDFERLLTGSRWAEIVLSSARGVIGAGICAGIATWIAMRHGAELSELYAPRFFYIVVVPAVAGFGWTGAWSATPSRWFIAALLLIALSMATFTLLRPLSRDNRIECQYWYPTGVHNVFGFRSEFRYEPWRWRLESAFDLIFVPGALGELTVSYIREPLTAQRC